jgi:hypothetical protein
MKVKEKNEKVPHSDVRLESDLEELFILLQHSAFKRLLIFRAKQLILQYPDVYDELLEIRNSPIENQPLPDNIVYMDSCKSSDANDILFRELISYAQSDPDLKKMLVHEWNYVLKPILFNND